MESGNPAGSEEEQSVEKRLKEQLIRAALEAADPILRGHAALMLGQYCDGESVSVLVTLLEDRDRAVRAASSRALAQTGDLAIQPLIRCLSHDDWKVRYRAAEALGLIGTLPVREPLIGAMRDERDHVRYMAVKGLRGVCDQDLLPAIVPLLGDENEFVRKSAVLTIASCGGPEAGSTLRKRLGQEASPAIREEISRALGFLEK